MQPRRETTPTWLLPGPLKRLREHLRETRRLAAEAHRQTLELRAEQQAARAEQNAAYAEQQAALANMRQGLQELADHLRATSETQAAQHHQVLEGLRFIRNDAPRRRERLRQLRADPAYEQPYMEPEPLVSVIIATADDTGTLRERAIPSVLAQTYQNFEVVVVGDAAPDEACVAVESFGDARLRFSNLPYRGPYPDEHVARWYSSGTQPFNEAAQLARGLWIAPLADDDAFRPEHLERLLGHARAERLELAYSPMAMHANPLAADEVSSVGRFPPEIFEFGYQAAIFHHGLAEIFELDLADAALGLPNDWGFARRLMESGVRLGMLDEHTVDYYPSHHWKQASVSAKLKAAEAALGPQFSER